MKRFLTFFMIIMFMMTSVGTLIAQDTTHRTKTGKLDRRYNANKHLKKDGTMDMRYKSSKRAAKKTSKSMSKDSL